MHKNQAAKVTCRKTILMRVEVVGWGWGGWKTIQCQMLPALLPVNKVRKRKKRKKKKEKSKERKEKVKKGKMKKK